MKTLIKNSKQRITYFFSLWQIYYTIFILIIQVYLIKNYFHEFYTLIKSTNYPAQQQITPNTNNTIQWNANSSTNITRDRLQIFIIPPLGKQLLASSSSSTHYQQEHIDLFYELLVRLLTIILILFLLILYVITSFKPIGNYANDMYYIGYDDECIYVSDTQNTSTSFESYRIKRKKSKFKKRFKNFFKVLWKHFYPLNSLLHLCIAFTLIYVRINFTQSTSGVAIDYPPTSQPGQQHTITDFIFNTFVHDYRLELLNYFLALFVLILRYSSIYWYINKVLTVLLSFIGLYITIEQLLQLYSYYYLYVCLATAKMTGLNLIQKPFFLNFIYFLHSFIQLLSLIPLYTFIYLKYKFVNDADGGHNDGSFIRTYCTHLIAIIHLTLLCICKLPLVYDYFLYYYEYYDWGIMVVLCVELVFILMYIFIWLLLTLKTNWSVSLIRVYDTDVGNEKLNYGPGSNGVTATTATLTTTSKTSNDDYLNSENLYRDEIRKSIHNVLKKSKANFYTNNFDRIAGTNTVLPTTVGFNEQPQLSIKDNVVDGNTVRKDSLVQHMPKSRRAVVSLDRGTSSYVEYESRV